MELQWGRGVLPSSQLKNNRSSGWCPCSLHQKAKSEIPEKTRWSALFAQKMSLAALSADHPPTKNPFGILIRFFFLFLVLSWEEHFIFLLIEPTKKDLMYLGAPQFIDRRTEPARVLDDRCCALSCQLSIILPFGVFFLTRWHLLTYVRMIMLMCWPTRSCFEIWPTSAKASEW